MKKFSTLLSIAFSIILSNAFAGTVYVDPVAGNDNYDGRSSIFSGGLNGPNRTIQGGVNDAVTGDTVLLSIGTYTGVGNFAVSGKDSIVIRGASRDLVLVDGQSGSSRNRAYIFNFITASGGFIRELKIENLSILNSDFAAIMALRTIGFEARNINILGAGVNSSRAPEADGIRVLESRNFIVENIVFKDLAQSGMVFGGGVFNGVVRDVDFENIGSGLFSGAISMWTGAGIDVPAADINNVTFEGGLTFENCSNGFVMESENGRSINLNAGNNVSSLFGTIENADILRYGVGSTPDLYEFSMDLGLNYVGQLGLIQGLEAIYQNLDSMLTTAQEFLYVNSAVCKNLEETTYYLKGDMLPSLALADITNGDSLVFFIGNFANKSLVLNKEIVLVSNANNTDINDLTIDGTDIKIGVVNNFTILNELNLDNGQIITSNTNGLFIKSGATIVGGKSTSFVSGPLHIESSTDVLTTLSYPVGKNDKYRPIEIWVQQSNNTPTYYKAEMIDTAATVQSLEQGLGQLSPSHYWEIDQFSSNSFDELFVFIEYQSGDFIFDPASLRVAAGDANDDWSNLGGSGNGTPKGRIRSQSLDDFYNIALATTEEGTSNFDPNGGGGSVGIEDAVNAISAQVFPNPTSDQIHLKWNAEKHNAFELNLYDMNGRVILNQSDVQNNSQVSLKSVSSGSYLLILTDEKGNYLFGEKIQKF